MADAPEDTNEARALKLFNELWNDPGEAGRALRAKAKEKYPEARLPEEVAEPLVAPLRAENDALKARLDKIEEERQAEREKAEENRVQQNLEAALSNARQRYNLTDEGFDKMCARIKETGNYQDIDAAAAWVVQQTPPTPPPGPYLGPQNINLFGTSDPDPQFEMLHKDPGGRFLDNEFRAFLADPDKYVREAGFA